MNAPNTHLQASWNKYGEHCFKFEILEVVDNELYTLEFGESLERVWCEKFKTLQKEFGYNIIVPGESKHRRDVKEFKETRKTAHKNKELYQIDINTNLIIKEWGCPNDVEKELGFDREKIYSALRGWGGKEGGKRKLSYKEFIWVYKSVYDPLKEYRPSIIRKPTGPIKKIKVKKPKKVRSQQGLIFSLIHKDTKEIRNFTSILQCIKELQITKKGARALIKGTMRGRHGNFINISQWKGWKLYLG